MKEKTKKIEIPDWLQEGYVRLATRHSDYFCNLEEHVSSGNGIIWDGYYSNAVAVGNYIDEDVIENSNFDTVMSGIDLSPYNPEFISDYYRYKLFHVSHISSMRDRWAVNLIKKLSSAHDGIIFTSTKFISDMLIRLGFHVIGTTQQWFGYELVDKSILTNSTGINLVYSIIKVIEDLKYQS